MSKFLKTTVAGIGLTLLKLYNWAKKGFGLKSLLGSIVKGVGGLGKGILNVASLLGNGVVGAARIAGQVAVGAGRLAIAAAPAIASTVATGASAAAGGLVAAGTFLLTNPVGWAILGVAIGYGIWRWFKDDFEPLDRFRLLAYGLVPEDHKDQANKLLAFEKEVWKETRFDESGKPTLDEIDYQKWAGLFWDETAGQPTQDAWVKHVQRFENWFNKRFRPTYMKHVTALKQIDPKIEPYDMDDDLDDGQKPGFARKAFFDKAELGQTPYDFLESPFTDVKALDANYNHLEHQRDVILAKYGEDEARLKRIAKGEKTLGDKIKTVALLGIFDDNQEEAKAKLAFEERDTYKDMSAKLAKETKKGDEMMIGSLTQIELTDKDGKKKFVTLEESGYKLPESSNEFEFLNMMMLGMPAEVSRADYELLREVEYQVSLKLVKDGKGYAYNGEAQELIDRFITSFGWDSSNKNDQEAFGKWVTLRLIPYVCAKKKAAMLVNKNVDYPMMAQSLEFNELYDIMKRLVIEFIEIPGIGRCIFLDVPYRPFKNNLAKPDHPTFAKWLEQLKNRKGKNQFKTLTDEEFRSFWNPRDLISLSRENLLLCYNSIRPNILPKLIKEHYFFMKSFNDQDNTSLANDRFAPLKLYDTKRVLEDYYENNEYVRSIIDNFNIYYLNLFIKDPKMLDKVGCNNALSSFQAIMSELVKVEELKFPLNDDLFKVLLSSSSSVCDLRYLCDYINETETILNDIKLDTKVNIYIESYNSQKSKNELILLELLKKSNPNIADIIKNNIRIIYKDYNNKIFLPQLDKDSFLVLKKMTEKYGIETNLSPELISELGKYLN